MSSVWVISIFHRFSLFILIINLVLRAKKIATKIICNDRHKYEGVSNTDTGATCVSKDEKSVTNASGDMINVKGDT